MENVLQSKNNNQYKLVSLPKKFNRKKRKMYTYLSNKLFNIYIFLLLFW